MIHPISLRTDSLSFRRYIPHSVKVADFPKVCQCGGRLRTVRFWEAVGSKLPFWICVIGQSLPSQLSIHPAVRFDYAGS